jgi:hypothetical protein
MNGLGINCCFDGGICGPTRESIPMGSLSTVFLVEVMAILKCTEFLLTKNLMRIIHICCDNRAGLAALPKTTTESFLVSECMQVLGRLSELNRVTLVWTRDTGQQGGE